MKTADLIPFLLIELNESDKYGFELTKNIETKSNGKIIIKQPTLYTLLKKLEKSKFITSYWQDSEIGGKRHYYKITDNGKLQLSTLPSYDVLMQNLLANEEADETENLSSVNESNIGNTTQPTETISKEQTDISTESEQSLPSSPVETVLPTEQVFANDSIDSKTESEINQENADLLKDNAETSEKSFATNIVIAKFVEAKPVPTPEIKPSNENKQDIVDLNVNIKTIENDINFVDYVNLKTSKEYKNSKKFSRLLILRSILISVYIIGLLVSFALLSARFGTSLLYYASFIIGSIAAIFYPIITATKVDKIKAKYKQKNYKLSMKISIISKLCIIIFVLLIVLMFNIAIENNSFAQIFSINNFTNFYVPVLLSTSLIIDSILGFIFISNIKK